MNVIPDWERDLEYVEKVHNSIGKVFNMDDEDRRLHLINMVPRDFGEYLLRESHRFPDYATVRAEVVEHIARSKRPAPRAGLQSLAQADDGEAQENQGEDVDNLEDLDEEEKAHIFAMAEFGEDTQQGILALVRNTKAKTTKGKGQGKKGDGAKDSNRMDISGGKGADSSQGKGPKDGCFICGKDHFARNCPHKEEAKAKGKGKLGGKKGGAPYPTLSQWNGSYPFPSKVAWGQWWPGQSGAPGKGPGQNDKVQALGASSWVDMLKAQGSLIGSLA